MVCWFFVWSAMSDACSVCYSAFRREILQRPLLTVTVTKIRQVLLEVWNEIIWSDAFACVNSNAVWIFRTATSYSTCFSIGFRIFLRNEDFATGWNYNFYGNFFRWIYTIFCSVWNEIIWRYAFPWVNYNAVWVVRTARSSSTCFSIGFWIF